MCYGDEPDINDSRLAEMGAEQHQDEYEAYLRVKAGMQNEHDVALIARVLNIKDKQEHRNDR